MGEHERSWESRGCREVQRKAPYQAGRLKKRENDAFTSAVPTMEVEIKKIPIQ